MAYSSAHAVPLLLTSVLATFGEENSEEPGSSSPFVIKNTFVCVSDSEDQEEILISPTSRRSLSAPPTSRKAHSPDLEAAPSARMMPCCELSLEDDTCSVASFTSTLATFDEYSDEDLSSEPSSHLIDKMINVSESEDEEESFPCASSLPFVIKNTFVCVSDDENEESFVTPTARRSSSAPPAPRNAQGSERESVFHDALHQRCPPSAMSACWSEASTSARIEDEQNEEVEENGLSPETDSESDDITFGSFDVCHDCVILALADLVPASAPAPRIALDTKAKAYRPSSDPPWSSPQVRQEFAEVMGAVETTLRSSPTLGTVKRTESAAAWSVVGVSTPEHLSNLQAVLEIAKQALAKAAEQSSNVFLVGYKATPCLNIPGRLAFSATLAYVEDEETACWDLLTKGCCARSHKCRWQHPLNLLQVSVGLEFQAGSSP